ncbi:hypothetical protein [Zhihengliuella halotolerans]|uniref:hypothetical protein n=1 Tax=Zhihengliuella halotolerans TaxID=370736 RepID=UPI000C8099AE|nr:hypothetical protein [Zhihengliuella halotolerans]
MDMFSGTARHTALALTACAAILLAGCANGAEGLPPAMWRIDDASPPRADSTSVDVLVTRLECSSGVTGEVNEPDVMEIPDEIVVTFTVEDLELGAATCQGNPEVPASFSLNEPLGERRLLDGQCADGDAATTSFCDSNVRWGP